MGGEGSRQRREERLSDEARMCMVQHEGCRDWQQVTSLSLDQWKAGCAGLMGFDSFDSWHCYNLKVHKKPWCSFSITGKLDCSKDKKLCEFTCEVYETGRQEQVSWWVKHSNVLAISDKIAVVQLVIAKAVKILVVDWLNNRLLATYSFAYLDEACLQECFISPDSHILLLRQNFHLRRSLGHIASFDANIRVLQVKDGLCERLFVLEDNLALNCFGSGISFDPRIPHGRVVLVAGSIHPADDTDEEDEENLGIQVYDIRDRQVVRWHHSTTDRIVHHIKHSSDGSLLAVMCVNISMAVISTIFIDRIQVLDGNCYDLLHEIPFQYCGPCKPLLSQAFPAFSRDGSYLATVSIGSQNTVQVYKMPCMNMELQAACRRTVLKCVSYRHLHLLPLPKSLIHYLRHCQFSD